MLPVLRRRSFVSSLLAIALVAALGAPSAVAQRPQFRARVEVVQFQVRVTDGSGAFVPGLDASDFQLRVNGAERPITTVYEVNLVDEEEAPEEQLPPAAWRQWVLFFDAAFNTPRGVFEAQAAARDFVANQTHPRDLIGVATYNAVRGASMVVPLTRDREQVLTAIGGLGLNTATRNVDRAGFLAGTMSEGFDPEQATPAGIDVGDAIQELINQVGTLEFEQYASVVAQYTENLGGIGELMRTIRGRKHVVYFSNGFDDAVISGQSLNQLSRTTDAIQQNAGLALAQSSGEDRFGSAEVRSALDDAVAVFRSADAVVHVVDPGGLGSGRDQTGIASQSSTQGDFGSRGGRRSALTALAGATGGAMYWETNDLTGALTELEESNRSYYVLAFQRQDGDDELLELDISVAGDATVEAPEELAAPADYTEMDDLSKQIQLAEFIAKGIEQSDLVFDVAVGAFYGDGTRNRLPVVVEVPWSQLEELASSGSDDKVDLEIYSYALDEDDRMVDLSNGVASLDLGAMRSSPAAGLPFRYYDLLWAQPGERRVRVILRDSELGRISAVTSAPAAVARHGDGQPTISGPIGVDWEHPGLVMRGFKAEAPPPHKEGGPVEFPFVVGANEVTPAAALAGPPGSSHHAYFVAHNLGVDAEGSPQAMVMLALQSPGGEFIQLAGQEMVARSYDEWTSGLQMLVRATLPPTVQPGYYDLLFLVQDQIKGERMQATLPIWVEAQ